MVKTRDLKLSVSETTRTAGEGSVVVKKPFLFIGGQNTILKEFDRLVEAELTPAQIIDYYHVKEL